MIFLWILGGLTALVWLVVLVNWWRDEQEKAGKRLRSRPAPSVTLPALSVRATPLHPSIDPYLAELRAFLLTPPLPQGPGEMAERVYTHLNQWVNTHLTEDALHTVDLEGDLLVEPTSRFIDMSRNEAAPPPGYLEDLMSEEQ
jgi:hypothetical protein